MDLYKGKYRISSARLSNWDYSSNAIYFVTICTKDRQTYFGEIKEDNETQGIASLHATKIGSIASEYWKLIPVNFPFVELDEFIIMPDHIHGVLLFNKTADTGWQFNKFGPQSNNLASIIRGFKAGVKSYATTNNMEFNWQSRFYDRVVRDRDELDKIRRYIIDNPSKWVAEKDNPENLYR